MTVREVCEIVGGRLHAATEDVLVTGVAIDSRRLAAGDLFVALPGERADGHDFVAEAAERGAAAVLVREPAARGGPASIVVEDPASALRALAAEVRARLEATVVAITGSSGKTITKELVASVAASQYRVTASEASFNNEIGVPLTVLGAGPDTQVIVAEVGSRGVGHIKLLLPVLRPDIAVVLNVGSAHIGMFGSVEAIAQAKGELVEELDPSGWAILNADDERVAGMAARTHGRVLMFGLGTGADVRAKDVELNADACASFTLVSERGSARVRLRIPGEHLVADALAAAAVGRALEIPPEGIAAALSDARGPAWRMEVLDTPGGWRLVNDAYNANPASTAAALRALVAMGRGKRTWAVLGGMAELGEATAGEHDRVGRLAVRLGVRRLVVVGEEARPMFEAARREGMTPEEATHVADAAAAVELLRASVAAGDVVLVKASRAIGLEQIAIALTGEAPA